MLYTVECSYSDDASEGEWNTFYNQQKLPALLSVAGFRTSQRFQAITAGYPSYFAIHTIENADVLTGEAYRVKGGGNFSHWQPYITDWHRNIYDGEGLAPAVSIGEYLLLSKQPLHIIETELGYRPLIMQALALENSPNQRIAYIIASEHAELCRTLPEVCLYRPLTTQLHSATTY